MQISSKTKFGLLSILLIGLIFIFSAESALADDCTDTYGSEYACQNFYDCDPTTIDFDYTLCGQSGYLYCCKKLSQQKSCSDLGPEYGCYFYDECQSNIADVPCGSSLGVSKVCCIGNTSLATSTLIINNPLSPYSDIWQLIMRLINIAQNIGVFICVILIVWAGYLYVTSAGNTDKVKQAQKTLIWTLVGLGIIVIAGAIPGLIYEFITGNKLNYNNVNTAGHSISGGTQSVQMWGGIVCGCSPSECRDEPWTCCYEDLNALGDDPNCFFELAPGQI